MEARLPALSSSKAFEKGGKSLLPEHEADRDLPLKGGIQQDGTILGKEILQLAVKTIISGEGTFHGGVHA